MVHSALAGIFPSRSFRSTTEQEGTPAQALFTNLLAWQAGCLEHGTGSKESGPDSAKLAHRRSNTCSVRRRAERQARKFSFGYPLAPVPVLHNSCCCEWRAAIELSTHCTQWLIWLLWRCSATYVPIAKTYHGTQDTKEPPKISAFGYDHRGTKWSSTSSAAGAPTD